MMKSLSLLWIVFAGYWLMISYGMQLFACDAQNFSITCSHLNLSSEDSHPFVISFETIQRPLQLHQHLVEFLCRFEESCKFHVHNEFLTQVLDLARANNLAVFIDNFKSIAIAINSYVQHLAQFNKMSYPHSAFAAVTMEHFSIKWFWMQFFSTVIILSGDACYEEASCPYVMSHPDMIHTLKLLSKELEDYKLLSDVKIAYGFAFPPTLQPFFEANCRQLTTYFHDSFPEISVACIAHHLYTAELLPGDKREAMARIAYDLYHSDFYLFVDLSVDILIPCWLLTSVASLLIESREARDVISVSISKLQQSQALVTIPTALVLKKTHFERYDNDQQQFFAATLPSLINNYLIASSYRAVQAVEYSSVYYEMMITKLPVDLLSLEDYLDQLSFNQRILLSDYQDPDYHSVLLSSHCKDEMVRLYCNHNEGCVESSDADRFINNMSHHQQQPESFLLHEVVVPAINQILLGSQVSSHSLKKSSHRYYPSNTHFYRLYPPPSSPQSILSPAKVAVITAIFGEYEASCKPYARQTIPTDFICFTDNSHITSNHWIVDTIPYHLLPLREEFEQHWITDAESVNSLHHNQHPFNLAKFYKLSFHHIPILEGYDIIIWLDGTIRITNPHTVETVLKVLNQDSRSSSKNSAYFTDRFLTVFEHVRSRELRSEAIRSISQAKYSESIYRDHYQPIQPIQQQVEEYQQQGLSPDYWIELLLQSLQVTEGIGYNYENLSLSNYYREQYGMWCTCFIAFGMRKTVIDPIRREVSKSSVKFLESWSRENRRYSTQDQISFPFVIKELAIYPYSLPDEQYEVYGSYNYNSFFVKLDHGL